MTTLRQAAQQALEALENHTAIKHPQQIHYRDSAIETLREALAEEALQRLTDVSQEIEATLAEPEQEHAEQMAKLGWQYFECPACGSEGARAFPKPVQEPVFDCPRCGHCCPQIEQDPVAWMEMVVSNLVREGVNKHKARQLAQHFTAPPQRLPLTEEEIEQAYRNIWRNIPADFDHTIIGWIEQGIRYAEQAHGIKGEA